MPERRPKAVVGVTPTKRPSMYALAPGGVVVGSADPLVRFFIAFCAWMKRGRCLLGYRSVS